MRLIGVDIGGTSIKVGLFTEVGESLAEIIYPTEGHLGGTMVFKKLIRELKQFAPFDAIGISSAGQIDPMDGVFLGSVNIPGLTGMQVKKLLEDHFHVPVKIANDVNAAALGERTFGVGSNYENFLFLTFGTGIGGAIVENGEIYYGKNAFAGEFGHMIIHAGGRMCNCGLQGCYEKYASTTALISEAMNVNPDFNNGKILFNAFRWGDPAAKKVIETWVDEIAVGLINLVHIFNPATIIIGGGMMEQDVLVGMIQNKVDVAILPSFKEVTLVKASLGNKAGMLGAISLHL